MSTKRGKWGNPSRYSYHIRDCRHYPFSVRMLRVKLSSSISTQKIERFAKSMCITTPTKYLERTVRIQADTTTVYVLKTDSKREHAVSFLMSTYKQNMGAITHYCLFPSIFFQSFICSFGILYPTLREMIWLFR